jgi:hypothetical protein
MDIDGDGVIDTAMAVVWANEFNLSSQGICGSSNSKLNFRVDRSAGEAVLPPVSATNLNIGCQDIGSQEVRLYVIDENGYWDYCSVILVVQDNSGTCGLGSGNNPLISGTMMTEDQNVVELASVALKSDDGEIQQTLADLIGDPVLKINSRESLDGHLILLQNQPNPFSTETKVSFYIDERGPVHLSVFNLNGTQLQTTRRFVEKGYNQWIIKDLPASLSSGLLYYKVETSRQTAIKKMVLLR